MFLKQPWGVKSFFSKMTLHILTFRGANCIFSMKTKKNNTNKYRYKQHEKIDKRRRPNICTTEKYIQNRKAVPGNRIYSSATKYGKKSWLFETVISKESSGTYLIIHLKQQKAISNCLVVQYLKTSCTTFSFH